MLRILPLFWRILHNVTLPNQTQHNVINYLLIIVNMYTFFPQNFHLVFKIFKLSFPKCHFHVVIKLSLPNCHYQIVTFMMLPKCHCQIFIIKLSFPNCHFCVLTKLSLPNRITKLSLSNCHYQIDITKNPPINSCAQFRTFTRNGIAIGIPRGTCYDFFTKCSVRQSYLFTFLDATASICVCPQTAGRPLPVQELWQEFCRGSD